MTSLWKYFYVSVCVCVCVCVWGGGGGGGGGGIIGSDNGSGYSIWISVDSRYKKP